MPEGNGQAKAGPETLAVSVVLTALIGVGPSAEEGAAGPERGAVAGVPGHLSSEVVQAAALRGGLGFQERDWLVPAP